ncbi:MAG: DUF4209 domain-containing protein, partial [Gammaproteobacteria bacterium]
MAILIPDAKRATVDVYARAFNTLSKERQAEGKNKQAAALALLSVICGFVLAPGREDGPYAPVMSGPHGRSGLPEDLSQAKLDIIAHVLPSVSDFEFQARLGDLLWLLRRDYKAGRVAVEAYLAAAQRLESEGEHFHVPVRIERAVQIAAQLGGGRGDLLKQALKVAGILVRDRAKVMITVRTPGLLDILIDRDDDNMAEWAALSEQVARDVEKERDYHLAISFWARAAQAHRKADNSAACRNALIQEAETYVRLADDASSEMVKASFIRSAFEAYRQISDTQKRRDELHDRLIKHQEKALGEMGRISTPLDLGDTPRRAREAVKGEELLQALYSLAIILVCPIRLNDLRKQAENFAKETPLYFMLKSEKVNALGRVVTVKPSGLDDSEGAIRSMMHDLANFEHQPDVLGVINPARQQILEDHPAVRIEDLEQLLSHNAFVPRGRQLLFARGLVAGLRGDFLVAAHLLIPQIENSLRVTLQRMGVITTGLDSSSKRQNEQSLNVTLYQYREQLETVFGADVVFELQNLLVEPAGANLRNEAMHGIMDDGAFFSYPVVYLWWLTLRLCCLGN